MSIDSPPPEVKKILAPSSGTSSVDPRRERLGLRRREPVVGLVRGELAHLLRGRVGELAPAVADVAVPERGGDVEQRVSGVVPDRRALAADDRDALLAEGADVRHRIPERALCHVGDANGVLTRVPWWLDEAPPDPETPPLAGDAEADVAIVGGGYTGLWTALELRRRDPGAPGRRPRGGARRLRAERAERRLSRDVLVRAAAAALSPRRRGGADARPRVGGRDRRGRGARRGRLAAPRRHARGLDDGRAGRGGRGRDSRRGRARRSRAGRAGRARRSRRSSAAAFGSPTRRPSSRRGSSARSAAPRSTPASSCTSARGSRRSVPARSPQPPAASARPEIVVATNAWLTGWRPVRGRLTPFGSYVVLTEPVPELLDEIGWTGGEAIADGRMFLHYFRTTADGRVLMGSGSGPIGRGGRIDARFFDDAPTVARAEQGLRRLLPGLAGARVERAWGGPIDVSSDQLPFFGTVPGHADPLRRGLLRERRRPELARRADPRLARPRRRRRVVAAAARAAPAAAAAARSRVSYARRRRRAPGDPRRSRRRTRTAAARRRSPAASPRCRACSACGSETRRCRLDAFALALGAAVLHALWNVLLARTRDPQAATAAAFCMAVAIWAPVAAVRWRVEAGAWKYIAASAAFELAYVLLLCAAYARAPLSVFYPIARGLAPVLVLVVAVLALGADDLGDAGGRRLRGRRRDPARPRPAARPGGDALRPGDRGDDRRLHADRQHRRHPRRPARLPRGGDDRAGGRVRGRRRRSARAARRSGPASARETLLIAPLTLAPYALTLYALRLAPAAPVAAVRETSVLFVAAARGRGC